jgi:hypothetical protein
LHLQYGSQTQHQVAHAAIRQRQGRALAGALAAAALLRQYVGDAVPAAQPEGPIQHSQKAIPRKQLLGVPESQIDAACRTGITQHMSFGRVLLAEWLRWPLLLAAFLGMAAAGLSYAGPIFIKHIMFFIKDSTPTHGEQRRAFLYATLWFVLYLLRIFVNMQAQWLCFQSSIRAEQVMHLTVYDKMMQMSYSYRRLMEEGDFMALFSIDTKIVVAFIKVFSVLFSAPTTLITSQAFLYAEVGKYGPIMTGVVIFGISHTDFY